MKLVIPLLALASKNQLLATYPDHPLANIKVAAETSCRKNVHPLRASIHRDNFVFVLLQHGQALVSMRAPQTDSAVGAGREQGFAIDRERQIVDGVRVAGQNIEARLCGHIPGPHGAVLAAGVNDLLIGRQQQADDASAMTFQRIETLLLVNVPAADDFVMAARINEAAIRRGRHRVDGPLMAEDGQQLLVGHVPDLDLVV